MYLFCLEYNAPCNYVNGGACTRVCYDCVQCVTMEDDDAEEVKQEE